MGRGKGLLTALAVLALAVMFNSDGRAQTTENAAPTPDNASLMILQRYCV